MGTGADRRWHIFHAWCLCIAMSVSYIQFGGAVYTQVNAYLCTLNMDDCMDESSPGPWKTHPARSYGMGLLTVLESFRVYALTQHMWHGRTQLRARYTSFTIFCGLHLF